MGSFTSSLSVVLFRGAVDDAESELCVVLGHDHDLEEEAGGWTQEEGVDLILEPDLRLMNTECLIRDGYSILQQFA